MEMRIKVKKSKLEKIVTNSPNQLKNEKYKKIKSKEIKSKEIQKILAKNRNLLTFCPFCSADESFNRKQMRCFACGIIVTQLKDYEQMVSKL